MPSMPPSSSDRPEKMAKYHVDPESTFRRWADAWLDPGFRSWNIEKFLEGIRCPVLVLQCEGDEYGSLRRLVLPGPGHSPHLVHSEPVTEAIVRFVGSLRGEAPST